MDNLLSLIFRAANVGPRYEESLCLAARKTTSCSRCRDACPHQAITIHRKVEIDQVDCTGCGLCVQACPSQALQPRLSIEGGAPLRCSRVKGSAQSVQCLARLQPSDLLRLVGSREGLTLARGDCAGCPIGGAAVANAIETVRDQALELAAVHKRPVSIEIVETDRLDHDGRSEALSRRELLRGGWRGMQQRTGDLLAPLDPGEDEAGLPAELQRRFRIIAAGRPEPEALVPWRLPRITDDCIMCPACTTACPSGALKRVFEGGPDGVLQLRPDHCMSCDACVDACPVGAVSMDGQVTWGELSTPVEEAHRRDPLHQHGESISR
jgi:formate hydrogenlyase subunit 6/NADH:ubiquinone oxidoreductase subunit I